ncbi:hypothetical protein CDQ84_13705 [Clostridium thermosuccinogenes]|uniref:DUF4825 domain-containing protein n=1 Tax=Clostridium thermosuccinogenes TaxID=84032 RepID=A0A2K2FEM0_9CLOT|nr:hypothetical protein CDO33_15925 [Pseudoclostridium thermosuccinogenes]PNT95865.1 hypothetical protein CDQ85_13490 [Pseudoclostridium thermosuccinogenes]PNT97233.1 hypothetical protein CDQ84_13705 [Pseudoclostridium thermosuccinogenes]
MHKKRGYSIISILILMISTAFLVTSCSRSDEVTLDKDQNVSTVTQNEETAQKEETTLKEEDGEINTPYDFGLLYTYRNTSLSDSNKMQELVGQLQYAKELPVFRIESITENKDSLRIDYQMNLTAGQQYKVNHTKKMADAVILFALLDNLNAVEINLVQADYCYGGVPITREQAEQVLNMDINSLGKTEEVFLSDMSKIIADLQWDPDVMDIITYEHIMGLDE